MSTPTRGRSPEEMKSLVPDSQFSRRIFKARGHVRQHLRGCTQVARIDVIEKVTSDTREVNRPRGSQLGHAPRRKFGDITSCVRRARGLRHEATGLEIVHQTSRTARREIRSARQVCHSQFAIRSFREVHDRGVLARRHANTSDEVAVEESRKHLKDSHLGPPKRFLIFGEWLGRRHATKVNLLCQATYVAEGVIPAIVSTNTER